MKARTVALCVLVICCGAMVPARAMPILDQEFAPDDFNLSSGIGGSTDKAQTFTVGVEGILASFEFYVKGSGDLTYEIRATTGGVPTPVTTSPLTSGTVAMPSTWSFASVDVSSAGIPVSPGDVLAIVARITSGASGSWQGRWSVLFASIPSDHKRRIINRREVGCLIKRGVNIGGKGKEGVLTLPSLSLHRLLWG